MGFLKQLKDMKATVAAAPGLIDSTMQASANAQALQAANMAEFQMVQQRAMQNMQIANAAAEANLRLDPIAGVSLEQYARIMKAIAPLNNDESALPGIAASYGVDGASWQQAREGWNARIQSESLVAKAFSDHYGKA